MLAQQVALAAPDKVAALALVGADLSGKDLLPKRGLSVLDIHGTRDVTNYGSLLNDTGIVSMQLPEYTFGFWRQANNINSLPDVKESNGLTVLDSKNAISGAEVKQVFIDGGSHTWPGPQAVRAQDRQLAATDAVWDFFSSHQRPVIV
jgi:poly(3-hydroxybutyrate) depolymerase